MLCPAFVTVAASEWTPAYAQPATYAAPAWNLDGVLTQESVNALPESRFHKSYLLVRQAMALVVVSDTGSGIAYQEIHAYRHLPRHRAWQRVAYLKVSDAGATATVQDDRIAITNSAGAILATYAYDVFR